MATKPHNNGLQLTVTPLAGASVAPAPETERYTDLKHMRAPSSLAFAIVVALVVMSCAHEPYILPIADGGLKPSPPSLEGRISSVVDHQIGVDLVRSDGSPPKTFLVRLTDTTEVFTVYGGHVQWSQLAAGQKVRVWLTRPGKPRKGETSYAAVVMLASKDPHDDWP